MSNTIPNVYPSLQLLHVSREHLQHALNDPDYLNGSYAFNMCGDVYPIVGWATRQGDAYATPVTHRIHAKGYIFLFDAVNKYYAYRESMGVFTAYMDEQMLQDYLITNFKRGQN